MTQGSPVFNGLELTERDTARLTGQLLAGESGITSFETEFLAHIFLPGGGTVGKWIGPQLETSYKTGKMPKLLSAG